jgi:hypothetical protein
VRLHYRPVLLYGNDLFAMILEVSDYRFGTSPMLRTTVGATFVVPWWE